MLCIIARDTRLTEKHQHLTILIQLNDLVPHPALRSGLSPVVNNLIRIGLCSHEPRVSKQPEKHFAQQILNCCVASP